MDLAHILAAASQCVGVVGAQVAVLHGGETLEAATGLANQRTGAAVTSDTLFQIGSTTKVLNAALVMTLVDEGRVDLDAPIVTYVPWLRLHDGAERRITSRHLLSMTSGLDNGPYVDLGQGDDVVAGYARLLEDVPLLFEPGRAFAYSNAGTNLAGLVAETVAGKPWHVLLRERILTPCGLSDPTADPSELLMRRVAIGHQAEADGQLRPMSVWGLGKAQGPAGGTLCASAGDLVRLASMFLSDGVAADGTRVLSAAAVTTMMTPQIECATQLMATHWGIGPYVKTWDGVRIHGHSGTNMGGSSMLLWAPERDIAIATTVNVAAQGYPLAEAVFDQVFPTLFGIDKPKVTAPKDTSRVGDARRYIGTYESLGQRTEICVNDRGRLTMSLTIESTPDSPLHAATTTTSSDLEPLSGDRFWPTNVAVSGNRAWDVAFFGDDGDGRAANVLNGMFASRRVA